MRWVFLVAVVGFVAACSSSSQPQPQLSPTPTPTSPSPSPTPAFIGPVGIRALNAQARLSAVVVPGPHDDAYWFNGTAWHYDAVTDTSTNTGAVLPAGQNVSSAAAWDGRYAYIFGGDTNGNPVNTISRFDPQDKSVTVMKAVLPTGLSFASAVWTGRFALVFGGATTACGANGCGYTDHVIRYDPATDTVETMRARLPSARINMSAMWDGANAYLFGGCCVPTPGLSQVLRYNPNTDTLTVMRATLPSGRFYTSAVWLGGVAYVFGGDNGFKDARQRTYFDQVLRYDPAADAMTVEVVKLPSPRSTTGAVVIENTAYIFGGETSSPSPPNFTSDLGDVLQYRPR